jgi:hypothetical protein
MIVAAVRSTASSPLNTAPPQGQDHHQRGRCPGLRSVNLGKDRGDRVVPGRLVFPGKQPAVEQKPRAKRDDVPRGRNAELIRLLRRTDACRRPDEFGHQHQPDQSRGNGRMPARARRKGRRGSDGTLDQGRQDAETDHVSGDDRQSQIIGLHFKTAIDLSKRAASAVSSSPDDRYHVPSLRISRSGAPAIPVQVCQFVSLFPGFAPSKLGIATPRWCIRLVPAVSEILLGTARWACCCWSIVWAHE